MLDIVQVILKLDQRIVHGICIGIVHLRPAGEPRSHRKPGAIEGNLFLQLGDELWALRTWADEAHIAPEHVEQLGHFVETAATQKASHSCDPLVVGSCP